MRAGSQSVPPSVCQSTTVANDIWRLTSARMTPPTPRMLTRLWRRNSGFRSRGDAWLPCYGDGGAVPSSPPLGGRNDCSQQSKSAFQIYFARNSWVGDALHSVSLDSSQ